MYIIISIHNCTFYLLGVLAVDGGRQEYTERLCSKHVIAIDKLRHYKFVILYISFFN